MPRVNSLFFGIAFAMLNAVAAAGAQAMTAVIQFDKRPPKVALFYVPGSLPQSKGAVVDQVDKAFTESLVVAAPGTDVVFKNSDDVNHNIFASDVKASANFDVGLMSPGGEKPITVDWKADRLVRVGCKIHPKMRTYIASVDAVFSRVVEFSPTTAEYKIDLSGVPEGANNIVLRIPKYDPLTINLEKPDQWQATLTKKGKPRGRLVLER